MSILYKKYLSLKIEDANNYYLFESGIFYLFIAEDAKFMSEKLNLKLTNLNSTVVKCGFPATQLNKYLSIFDKLNYPVKIVNSNSFLAYSQRDYITNIKSKTFIKNIANIKYDDLSISQAYDFIADVSREAKSIISEIENKNSN